MPTTCSRQLLIIAFATMLLCLVPPPAHAQSDPACGTTPPRLIVGGRARVITDPGETLRLRTAPTQNAGTSARLTAGDTLVVLQGPVCADGLRWWQLQTISGLPGWTAEGRGAVYFLAPVAGPTVTPTPPPSATPTRTPTVTLTPSATLSPTVTLTPTASPTPYPTATPSPTLDALCWTAPLPRLHPGDTATIARDIQGLRLRSLPAVGAGEERLLRPGTPFTVEDGPICNMGYHWYRVTLDSGAGGWLAEGAGAAYWVVPDAVPAFSPDQVCTAWTDAAGLHITQGSATLDTAIESADTLFFAPNGRFVAALSESPEPVLTVTDLAAGETVLDMSLGEVLPNRTTVSLAGWLPESSGLLLNGTDTSDRPAIWQVTLHGTASQLPVDGWQAAETFPGDLPYVALIRPGAWEVAVFDTEAGDIVQTYTPPTPPNGTAPATAIQWLTTGELYATFRATPKSGPSTIQAAVRLNPASGGVTPLVVNEAITQIEWAASGTPVVYTLTSGEVIAAPDLSGPGTPLHTIPESERTTATLSLSPDGVSVLLAGENTATLITLADSTTTPIPAPEDHALRSADWLAPDTLLLTTHPASAPDVTALWLVNPQTGSLATLHEDTGPTYALSPYGCWFPED